MSIMINRCIIWSICLGLSLTTRCQSIEFPFNTGWLFRNHDAYSFHPYRHLPWFPASVPGNVYADLYNNNVIVDPFFADNERLISAWVDSLSWEYKNNLILPDAVLKKKQIELVFDGLDTYATVFINGQPVLTTDNMFRQWSCSIKRYLHKGPNEIIVRFLPAQKISDRQAAAVRPLVYPDNNRVFSRKAQYQFGWDWGPTFRGAGIWKPVRIMASDQPATSVLQENASTYQPKNTLSPLRLIQQKDSIGTSFYFEKEGKPLYICGANWIPGEAFAGTMNRDKYRHLLTLAKEANMNMIRVWGGGLYEDDIFYELCDSLGIYVWQDFMFACAMYPANRSLLDNVHMEVKQQIQRLKKYQCIAVWCGNNEIDEAWKNWGWQQQYNLHGKDSVQIWKDYQTLFQDSLRKWVADYDGTRAYVPSSPKHGWGHAESFTEGDSHYWGVWWGLEDWEVFKTKTGRFVSEYGMQSMSNYSTIRSYTADTSRTIHSPAVQWHQKANNGFFKLNHYLKRYFIDSARLEALSLEEYAYLSQCMQAYVLRNAIITHHHTPDNMGTLLWQLNDCWPATSWSIIDYKGLPKAAWYAVKKTYAAIGTYNHPSLLTDTVIPKEWSLLNPTLQLTQTGPDTYQVSATEDARFVHLYTDDDAVFSDNYFDLRKNETVTITRNTSANHSQVRVRSLYDILQKRLTQ
ncbi:MAG: glycosyl hydrolase 2 galactose-binding domain-containing protein [Ferruginibacter sp.]